MVVVSSPTAISSLLKDTSGAFEAITIDSAHILSGGNVGKDRIFYVYSTLMGRASRHVYRAMMPSNLLPISSRFTQDFLKELNRLDLSASHASLHEFVRRMMYNASSTAFFGPNFPLNTYDDFMIFDHGAPLLIRHLGIFAGSATAARDAMYKAWNQHMVGNWISEESGHLEGAVSMMTNLYRELNETDLTPEEISRLIGLLIWTIHSNVLVLATWVMCHLLTNKNTYTSVCQEIRAYVDQKFPYIEAIAEIDLKTLEGDNFPLLNSFIREVIRTKTSMGIHRLATRDAVIKGDNQKEILIRKGEMVFANIPGMHYSSRLHPEPDVFKADRFVEEKESYKSYTFGMGRHAVRVFVFCVHWKI